MPDKTDLALFLSIVAIILAIIFSGDDTASFITGSDLNQPYGEAWNKGNHNTSAPFETVDLVTADVYVKVNNLTTGALYGVQHTNGTGDLIILTTGVYHFTANVDASAVTVGSEYGLKVFVNTDGYNTCYAHNDLSTDVSEMVIDCFVCATAGQNISIKYDDHADPVRDLYLWTANIAVELVNTGISDCTAFSAFTSRSG